jgi:hypothetical protein
VNEEKLVYFINTLCSFFPLDSILTSIGVGKEEYVDFVGLGSGLGV